ncbi:hypothetical protein D3C81_2274660 [compost metagenome]
MIEWANTMRGGREFDMLKMIDRLDAPTKCASAYGLCETYQKIPVSLLEDDAA